MSDQILGQHHATGTLPRVIAHRRLQRRQRERQRSWRITKRAAWLSGLGLLIVAGMVLAAIVRLFFLPKWTFQAAGYITSTPVVANGLVYVGSYDHRVYALDAASGNQIWSFQTGDEINASPAVANGRVYINSRDGKLYALDARSGLEMWSFPIMGNWISSSPVVVDGTVYIGSGDGNLYALDALSGSKRWSFRTQGGIYSSPTVANGLVYTGSFGRSFYAIDTKSGQQKWTFDLGSYEEGEVASVVSNDLVYVSTRFGTIYALDVHSGAVRWSASLTNGFSLFKPAVANGSVYVATYDSPGKLYALNALSGKQQWTFQPGRYALFTSSPVVVHDLVYVGTNNTFLSAVDVHTGVQKWSFQTKDASVAALTIADGVIYAAVSDQRLYAIQAPA